MMDEHAREPISPDLARYRAIFISDVHLGTRNSQTRQLLAFLRSVEADTVYLVGDIIDGWRLRKSWYWPQEHNDVVQKLLRKVRNACTTRAGSPCLGTGLTS
jgi:hypothetical protein